MLGVIRQRWVRDQDDSGRIAPIGLELVGGIIRDYPDLNIAQNSSFPNALFENHDRNFLFPGKFRQMTEKNREVQFFFGKYLVKERVSCFFFCIFFKDVLFESKDLRICQIH